MGRLATLLIINHPFLLNKTSCFAVTILTLQAYINLSLRTEDLITSGFWLAL